MCYPMGPQGGSHWDPTGGPMEPMGPPGGPRGPSGPMGPWGPAEDQGGALGDPWAPPEDQGRGGPRGPMGPLESTKWDPMGPQKGSKRRPGDAIWVLQKNLGYQSDEGEHPCWSRRLQGRFGDRFGAPKGSPNASKSCPKTQ